MKFTPSLSCTLLATGFVINGCGEVEPLTKPIANEHAQHAHNADEHDHSGSEDPHAGHDHGESEDPHAGHDHGESEDPHAGHDHGPHDERIVSLTEAELEEFDIQLATAGSKTIEITTDLSGEVVMNPDAIAHVVARAAGIARQVYKTTGDTVTIGEELAVLESPDLAEAKAEYLSRLREHELARTDLTRAETVYENTRKLLDFLRETPSLHALRKFADLDLGANRNTLVSAYAQLLAAEASYTREKSLFEKQIGSEAEYLEAESMHKQAQAAFLSVRDDLAFSNQRTLDQRRREEKVAEVALLAAQRRLLALGLAENEIDEVSQQTDAELARYLIDAPIEGVVTNRHLVTGEQIDRGSDIFTIADLTTVWIELTVYQKDLPIIRRGQSVQITASHNVAEATGTIDYVNPVIDEDTRTTTARIVLENPNRAWLPGMFVEGAVMLQESASDVVVSRDAIQTIDDQPVVFVKTETGFEPVEITLGGGDRRRVIVTNGLSPGQRYAATNTFTLKSELGRAALEHAGHSH